MATPEEANKGDAETGHVIPVNFIKVGQENGAGELEIEDQVSLMAADIVGQGDFIRQQAQRHGARPVTIVEAALSSYKDMCDLLDDGGTFYVRTRSGQLHRINSGPADIPPAV